MNKGQRHMRIRELVVKHTIKTQDELVDLLHESGLHVTQATVSRDIKELFLMKVALTDGSYKYSLPPDHKFNPLSQLKRLISEVLVDIQAAKNLVVLKTLPGNAHAVGVLIDNLDWEKIIGTICGNDTILIISPSDEDAIDVKEHFNTMLNR